MKKLALLGIILAACSNTQPPPAPTPTPRQYSLGTDGTALWWTVPIHYVRTGPATSTHKVILLHENAMDSSEWADVQAALTDFDVIAIDLLGHGQSACNRKAMSVGSQAEVVEAVMDSVGWDAAHWVGVGLGGLVAVNGALHESAPRIKTLTLLATHGVTRALSQMADPPAPANGPSTPPDVPDVRFYLQPTNCAPTCARAPVLWPPSSTKGAKLAYSLMLNKKASIVTDQFAQDMFAKELARACLVVTESMNRNGRYIYGDHVLATDLANWQSAPPTLILWGDADNLLKATPWTQAWNVIPRSSVQIFPGCGHDLPRDCPDEVSAKLKSFISAY